MFKRLKNINFLEAFKALFSKESPFYVKALLILALIYIVYPIDILPDFLGLIGWVDDAAIVTGLVSLAMKLLENHKLKHAGLHVTNEKSGKRKDVTHSVRDK